MEPTNSGLLISAREVSYLRGIARLAVGTFGKPTAVENLEVGDYIVFTKSEAELTEIRLVSISLHDVAGLHIRAVPVGVFAESSATLLGDAVLAADEDNSPLSVHELDRIHVVVEELRSAIQALATDSPHLHQINSQLSRMEEAATKLGRKDWTTLVLGTVTNIIILAALGPEPARSLFGLASKMINWCFSSGPSLP